MIFASKRRTKVPAPPCDFSTSSEERLFSLYASSIKLPIIKEGMDIGELLVDEIKKMGTGIEDNDIIVVAHTAVSKSEGRTRLLKNIKPTDKAIEISRKKNVTNQRFVSHKSKICDDDPRFIQAILDETEEIIIEYPPIFLVKAKCGNICINAGVDRSNIEDGSVILLPKDPDLSARKIGERIAAIEDKKVGVIISDTNGRPFRRGQVGFAIGAYNLDPIRDWKGKEDIFGRILRVSEEAIVDELAGLANILMGEGDWMTPAVLIRGLSILKEDARGIKTIYRDESTDYIKKALKKVSKIKDFFNNQSDIT